MRARIPWSIALPIIASAILILITLFVFKKFFYFTRENKGLDDCNCIIGQEEYTSSPTINSCDCIFLKGKYYSVKEVCSNKDLKDFIEDCINNYMSNKECQELPKAYYEKYSYCLNRCCSK